MRDATQAEVGRIKGEALVLAGHPEKARAVTLNSKMDAKKEGNDKLLHALKEKVLPTKESIEPVEGYLYFPLDGKHKLKNLAVLYRGPAGKLNLEFEH